MVNECNSSHSAKWPVRKSHRCCDVATSIVSFRSAIPDCACAGCALRRMPFSTISFSSSFYNVLCAVVYEAFILLDVVLYSMIRCFFPRSRFVAVRRSNDKRLCGRKWLEFVVKTTRQRSRITATAPHSFHRQRW